jgi:malyl-CoA/(S)-citramalyl-CoA lyase
MTFKNITHAPARLNRSELAVPGSVTKFFEKAAAGPTDMIFLDLEDAVAPSDKESARANVIEALNTIEWQGKTMSVRVNGLDTHWMYRDIIDVVEGAGNNLDLMMIPKVGTPEDVYTIDVLLTQIEAAKGIKTPIGLELIIESALGMQNIGAIAAASPRIESLHFGVADYSASTGVKTTNIGGPNPYYVVLTDPDADGNRDTHWADMWHYPIVQMVIAARANGLRPIDGPFGNFKDEAGYRAQASRAAVLGCVGKWAIHPSQTALANEVFSPSDEEVAQAKRVLVAMEEAQARGEGAVALDGRLIDNASMKQAQVIVDTAASLEDK